MQISGPKLPTRNLLLLVGGGETGRALARRLCESWEVSLVERCPQALDALEGRLKAHAGDATSSLVLRAAGAARARAVLAAAGDDMVNLEVCRLCQHLFDIKTRIAVVSESCNLREFEQENITVIHRGSSLALAAESQLALGTRAASTVGLGQGEVCQVEVLPGSAAIGKTPRLLNPQSWLIAAIYREQKLIVPHGDTVICEGDSILLVGQPEILSGIANYFRAGTSEFPLQYGAKVVGLAGLGRDPRLREEVEYLAESSEATGFVMLKPDDSTSEEPSEYEVTYPGKRFNPKKISKVLDGLDSGCTVLRAPESRWSHRLGLGERSFFKLIEAHTEPVLITRGTFPYRRIALGVQPGTAARFAAEMAVDFARGMGCELTAITAVPSPLINGDGYQQELEESLAGVASLGELYGLDVDTRIVRGNPVLKLLELSQEYDLIVLAHRVKRAHSPMNPDISRHLILRSRCSVLCLPHCLSDEPGSVLVRDS